MVIKNSNLGNEYADKVLTYSSGLVEKFGEYEVLKKIKLRSLLTIKKLSYWDIFSVEFAHSFLPLALERKSIHIGFIYRFKSYLRYYKNIIKDFFYKYYYKVVQDDIPVGRTFIFLGFSARIYRDTLAPIVELLSKRTDCQVIVLYDQKIVEDSFPASQNLKYESIWQHWAPKMGCEVHHLCSSIDAIYLSLVKNNSIAKMLSILIKDHTKSKNINFLFHKFFKSQMRNIVPRVILAENIIKKYKPSLLITSDMADSRVRVYTSLCKSLNIPTLEIQYGMMGNEGLWRFFNSDAVATWGQSSKAIMIKEGVPDEKIIVTGAPRHDESATSSREYLDALKNKYSESGRKIIILLASTYFHKSHKDHPHAKALNLMRLAISEATASNSNLMLLVKPHPHEDVKQTKKIFSKFNNIIFIDKDLDIRDYIYICDVFVSFGSTATMDALASKKLTICPVFPDWGFSKFYENSGAVLTPKSIDDIFKVFSMLSAGLLANLKKKVEPFLDGFIEEHLLEGGGKSAERIEKVIFEMSC